MRPQSPDDDDDAESAEMNTETVDPREATDIDQLRREIDRLDT